MNLTDLPPEVLLTIFIFLDTKFILCTVSKVCKLFYDLTLPELTWKTRCAKLWSNRMDETDDEYITSWKEISMEYDSFGKHWLNPTVAFDSFKLSVGYPIDSVLTMMNGDLLLCGSRDRSIAIWDTKHIASSSSPINLINHHSGWIWTLVADPSGSSTFCSGSWDSNIVLWDMADDVRLSQTLSVGSATLCMSWKEDLMIAGCYDKSIRLIDPRTFQIVSTLQNHSRAVLCLHVDDNFIISGSEDKRLCIYDRKAGKLFQTLELSTPVFSLHKWTSGYDILRAGGRNGKITLLEKTSGSFRISKTVFLTKHTHRITDMTHFKGALLTASADKTLQVHDPTILSPTRCILDEQKAEVTRLSVCGDVLASVTSDGNISLWKSRV